jgi:predicted transcriptional regulator
MSSSTGDIAFLARSDHRSGALEALAAGPRDRDALREATGASAPTVSRVLGAFESRRWVERDGRLYRLTPLGEFVAERYLSLRDAMETERRLRDVWRWLPVEMEGFRVDLFADAVISYPGPRYPYEPVERVSELIEGTDTMRGFGTTVYKSLNNETMCRSVLSGMEFEYVYKPAVLEATVAWDPERVAEAAACENCTVLLHDGLPDEDRCGLGVFDDRVGICCHDAETGQLEAVVDTDAPEAHEWALSVYERHRAEARPADEAYLSTLLDGALTA